MFNEIPSSRKFPHFLQRNTFWSIFTIQWDVWSFADDLSKTQTSSWLNVLLNCTQHTTHENVGFFQQIDGEAFLLLTQTDLVKILSMKLGPALKIFNSILMFKTAEDSAYNELWPPLGSGQKTSACDFYTAIIPHLKVWLRNDKSRISLTSVCMIWG